MKILHVCSNYYPAHGGPQYTIKNVSENLVAFFGDDVSIATSNSLYGPEMDLFKKIEPSVQMLNAVNINRFSFRRWHYTILTIAHKIFIRIFKKGLPYSIMKKKWALDCPGIDKMMKNSDAEIIMASAVNYSFCDYPFWRQKTKNPKPFVLYGSIHFHFDYAQGHPFLKRARACDCYIANTDFEKNKLIEYGVLSDKIITIGTGINESDYTCSREAIKAFREKYHIKQEQVLIGHIGRLSEGKGTGILLQAFEEIYKRNKNVRLLLAGTSTVYVDELKQKIGKSHLPVILIENFDDSLKPVLFNAIDIFVLASKGESFGVVFLEAWACKKPVVGANTDAVSSLITHDRDGLLFKQDDIYELINMLEVLIANKDICQRLGSEGYKEITEKYTWPVITAKFREAYFAGIEHFKKTKDQGFNDYL